LQDNSAANQRNAPNQISGELAFFSAPYLSSTPTSEAMRMHAPGVITNIKIGARMVEFHQMGGSEAEGYASIVGRRPQFHRAPLRSAFAQDLEDGDIVVSRRRAAVTPEYPRISPATLHANGKFTRASFEIYNIVLGAQNAALAALKPGLDLCRKSDKASQDLPPTTFHFPRKDLHGKSLGQYYIHGLGQPPRLQRPTTPAILPARFSLAW